MSGANASGAPAGSRYADQRPYVFADRLDDLREPTSGEVSLSRRLDWSGRARYDLDNSRCMAITLVDHRRRRRLAPTHLHSIGPGAKKYLSAPQARWSTTPRGW